MEKNASRRFVYGFSLNLYIYVQRYLIYNYIRNTTKST